MRIGRTRKRRDRGDLPLEDVASRITAYVYGNIIVLATLIPLSREDAQSGWSFWIVLGASATTFLAHTFAESVGLRVRSDHRLSREEARDELRNSMPVLTSGVFPAAVLGLAALFGAPGEWAQLAAEIYVIVRLGLTGVIVARIRKQPSSLRMILSGVGVAVVAAGIAIGKILVGH